VFLAQLEGRGKKKGRRPWRAHPPVGNDPVCWKECHVEGLSTQTGRGRTPFWLELGVVFALWAGVLLILCGDSLDWKFERVFPTDGSRPEVMPEFPFFVQGLTVMVVGTVLVAVRGAGAISSEKQRQTWDSLRLTALTAREIVRGKHRGILRAFFPYLAAALLPALLLSWTGGWVAVFWPVCWGVLTCVTAYFMAALGIAQSAQGTTAWERMGLTLVGGLLLLGMLTLAVVVPLIVMASTSRSADYPRNPLDWVSFARGVGGMLLFVLLILGGVAWAMAGGFLNAAERSIRPKKRPFEADADWGPHLRRSSRTLS
jgi:hypothetical protein